MSLQEMVDEFGRRANVKLSLNMSVDDRYFKELTLSRDFLTCADKRDVAFWLRDAVNNAALAPIIAALAAIDAEDSVKNAGLDAS